MQRFGEEELANLRKVIKSGILGQGNLVPEFEDKFASKFGAKYAVAMNSAMSGLHCAIAAAGVGPGDEVICDPIVHFGAVAVMYNNGVPVFADVDPYTFTIDPESVRSEITKRTKAIICTSIFGLPYNVDAIREIAKKYNLIIIEDNAQAIGAKYDKEHYVGTLGDMGVFSFQQSKQLASGDGGIVTTNDKDLANEMRITRIIGWVPQESRNVAKRWKRGRLGWNYRMTELVAAVLLAQLEKCEKVINLHRQAANYYSEVINDCQWLRPQQVPKGYRHTYWQFACRFEGEKFGFSLSEFKKIMKEFKVSATYGYTQVPASNIPLFTEIRAYGKGCPVKCPLYKGNVHYGPGVTPVAEDLLSRIVLLGMNVWDMNEIKANAERLAKVIKKVK